MTMDDPFESIVNGLELEEPKYYIDVTKLDIQELLTQFDELNDELFEMEQALRPTTQRARDLHSLRSAIYLEIQKRGKK
jgi:hypothetical protein